jgi:hypothetical protein
VARFGNRSDAAAEHEAVAFLHALGVADERLPAPEVDPLVQGRADLRLAIGTAAFELGGDHAGIVEHQHIACLEQRGQIAHAPVLERGITAAHHQHPRRITRAHGAQGNAFGRKLEIEQIYLHGRASP